MPGHLLHALHPGQRQRASASPQREAVKPMSENVACAAVPRGEIAATLASEPKRKAALDPRAVVEPQPKSASPEPVPKGDGRAADH